MHPSHKIEIANHMNGELRLDPGPVTMIKDLVVNLEHNSERDRSRDFAISIAEAFHAHIAGIAFCKMTAEGEKVALAAIERFDAAARRNVVSAEHRLLKATATEAPTILSNLTRRFDLGVLMQSDPDGVNNNAFIEALLFQSGRPLIVVPYIQKDGLNLEHVTCCWDGSRAAARAINDALPLLAKTTAVDLLIVLNEKTNTDQNRIRGAEIGKHLARHNVNIRIKTTPAGDIDVSSAILSYVTDNSSSLIVMGGYGHAKLREVILGGVTRDILKSMTVPVLMSH